MTGDTRKRPSVAIALAIVYPGLGHMYIRAWQRAMLWFGAIILTGVLFIPEGVFDGVAGLADIPAAAGHVPLDAVIALALIAAFNVVDVYITVKRSNASIEGVRCAHCGKVVDEELSFCHWCTTELSGEHA